MAWRPISDKHAIERVRVTCVFSLELRPKLIARLADLFEKKRVDLAFGPMQEVKGQGFVVQIGPDGPLPPTAQTVLGWSFQRKAANGSVLEAVTLENSNLIYESVDYSRWSEFHQRGTTILSEIVNEMLTFDDMAGLVIEFFDRFIFDGAIEKADPRDILEIHDDLIPVSALENGNLWHLHRGWFENGSKGKLLINQNLDAQDGAFNGNAARSVSVLTKIEARGDFWGLTADSLTIDLPEMHTRSKQVLLNVIKKDTAEMIGMEE